MDLTQMIPFEKNRYYPGKMLTTPDFKAEQQYAADKRRFLNQMVLGSGILCGLNVLDLDGLSILVESGAAIDPLGREIVVGSSAVRQISAIQGYREDVRTLSLCLAYRERQTQSVYVVNRREGQPEYEDNRIEEGWELILADAGQMESGYEPDSEFFVETELMSDRDWRITARMPATVCRGWRVRISLEAEKLSDRKKELGFSYSLQMPAFTVGDGSHCLDIREDGIELKKGERRSFDYWVYAQEDCEDESAVLFRPEKGRETELKIFVSAEEPEELIRRALAHSSLEIRESGSGVPYVRLADLCMRKTKTAYVVDHIEEDKVRSYVAVPADERSRAWYRSFFMESGRTGAFPGAFLGGGAASGGTDGAADTESLDDRTDMEAAPERNAATALVDSDRMEISGGTLEIPLPEKVRRGAVCVSEEICHGLGPGKVWVSVGLDRRKDGVNPKGSSESTIYGDTELFKELEKDMTQIKTAVRVWEERGSFQAAVKLMGEQNTVLLPLSWIAVRIPYANGRAPLAKKDETAEIVPESVTIHLRPREKYYISVKFRGMQACPLRYELTEEKSGRITEDGIYTAPMKSGVYEIKISCEDRSDIAAYVYAVVSRQ